MTIICFVLYCASETKHRKIKMSTSFCTKETWNECPHRDLNDGCCAQKKCAYRMVIPSNYGNEGELMRMYANVIKARATKQK